MVVAYYCANLLLAPVCLDSVTKIPSMNPRLVSYYVHILSFYFFPIFTSDADPPDCTNKGYQPDSPTTCSKVNNSLHVYQSHCLTVPAREIDPNCFCICRIPLHCLVLHPSGLA